MATRSNPKGETAYITPDAMESIDNSRNNLLHAILKLPTVIKDNQDYKIKFGRLNDVDLDENKMASIWEEVKKISAIPKPNIQEHISEDFIYPKEVIMDPPKAKLERETKATPYIYFQNIKAKPFLTGQYEDAATDFQSAYSKKLAAATVAEFETVMRLRHPSNIANLDKFNFTGVPSRNNVQDALRLIFGSPSGKGVNRVPKGSFPTYYCQRLTCDRASGEILTNHFRCPLSFTNRFDGCNLAEWLIGGFGSCTGVHTECHKSSVNVCIKGYKLWSFVLPEKENVALFFKVLKEKLIMDPVTKELINPNSSHCYYRTKRNLFAPDEMRKQGVKILDLVQSPGTIVVTDAQLLHQVINISPVCVASAVNFINPVKTLLEETEFPELALCECEPELKPHYTEMFGNNLKSKNSENYEHVDGHNFEENTRRFSLFPLIHGYRFFRFDVKYLRKSFNENEQNWLNPKSILGESNNVEMENSVSELNIPLENDVFEFSITEYRISTEGTVEKIQYKPVRRKIYTYGKPRPFVCECRATFIRKSHLQDHKINTRCKVQKSHEKCAICHREFRNLAALKYHHDRDHIENKHKCPNCGKTFNVEKNMKTHIRRKHKTI